MRVEVRDGGDGVRCWNVEPIRRFADAANAREAELAQHNPDLVVTEGRLMCYGCEVMEMDYGTRCTAVLTRTRYAVSGEIEPRAEDAKASLTLISGLLTKAPDEVAASAIAPVGNAEPETYAQPRRGLRGLLGRG